MHRPVDPGTRLGRDRTGRVARHDGAAAFSTEADRVHGMEFNLNGRRWRLPLDGGMAPVAV
jgi:hypothetical protein